jgi:hypothetical protein
MASRYPFFVVILELHQMQGNILFQLGVPINLPDLQHMKKY